MQNGYPTPFRRRPLETFFCPGRLFFAIYRRLAKLKIYDSAIERRNHAGLGTIINRYHNESRKMTLGKKRDLEKCPGGRTHTHTYARTGTRTRTGTHAHERERTRAHVHAHTHTHGHTPRHGHGHRRTRGHTGGYGHGHTHARGGGQAGRRRGVYTIR